MLPRVNSSPKVCVCLLPRAMARTWTCLASLECPLCGQQLTLRINIRKAEVWELDRLLVWLNKVSVRKASELARRIKVRNGKVKRRKGSIHEIRRDRSACEDDRVQVSWVFGCHALCYGRPCRMTNTNDVFERVGTYLRVADLRDKRMGYFDLNGSLDNL